MIDPAESEELVLDTSVWINLIATGAVGSVLKALDITCYAPIQVLGEIKRDPLTGEKYNLNAHPLLTIENVRVIDLSEAEAELFFGIIKGDFGPSVNDGEAASIAIAVTRGVGIVVDDRKARSIIANRFGGVRVFWSVDVLRSPKISQKFGSELSKKYFDNAREHGRMHMPRGVV